MKRKTTKKRARLKYRQYRLNNPINIYYFNDGDYTSHTDQALEKVLHIYKNESRVISAADIGLYSEWVNGLRLRKMELSESQYFEILNTFPKELIDYLRIPADIRQNHIERFSNDTRYKIESTLLSLKKVINSRFVTNGYLLNRFKIEFAAVLEIQKQWQRKRIKDTSIISELLAGTVGALRGLGFSDYQINQSLMDLWELFELEDINLKYHISKI
jgi:hypothetical protein